MIGIGQPPEQRPPVVDERDQAGDDPAALQVVGGEAGPAPVVLQLVEGIFAVAAIPVELSQRADLEVEGGDEHAELPHRRAVLGIGPEQLTLAAVGGDRHGHRLLQPAAQEDHPPLPAPPLQAQLRLPAPPALAGILPVAGAHRLLQETAHPARQAQLEQVVHPLLLAAAHVALAAPVLVAAHQRRPALRRQPAEMVPQMRLGMLGAVAVAGFHRNVQDQAHPTHHEAVVGVRGPSGLQRIVADHGTLLAAVKRLDRRIDVENPRLGQQRPHRLVEVAGEPARPASASILSSPRRTASSLTTLVMPNSGGSTVSPRSSVMCA